MANNTWRWIRRYRMTLFILLVIFVVGTSAYINQLRVASQLEEEQAQQIESIRTLHREVDRLQTEYDSVNTEEHIEKVAREKLKMVKPNEIIYIIKDQE